jgi:hypothetical protein
MRHCGGGSKVAQINLVAARNELTAPSACAVKRVASRVLGTPYEVPLFDGGVGRPAFQRGKP